MNTGIKHLTFDEEEHRFAYKGQPVPSVTQILRDLGYLSNFYTEKGKTRGKNVHVATEYLDLGTLDWDSVDSISPYIESYQLFLKQNDVTILGVEQIVFSPTFWYAGILDRVAMIKGELCLLSLKSGKYEWWHDLQETAYNLTRDEILPMYGVYLSSIGACAVKKKLGRPKAQQIWQACCIVYHDKHKTERKV